VITGLTDDTALSTRLREGDMLANVALGFPQLVDDLLQSETLSDHLLPFVVILD